MRSVSSPASSTTSTSRGPTRVSKRTVQRWSPSRDTPARERSASPVRPSSARTRRSAAWTLKGQHERPRYRSSASCPEKWWSRTSPHVVAVDSPVVDAVRERDEIPGEPVAADVGALPGGRLVQLFADSLPERAPVPRAAAVVLSVRADEKERLVELLGGFERVDPAKLLVLLQLRGRQVVRAPLANRRRRSRRLHDGAGRDDG